MQDDDAGETAVYQPRLRQPIGDGRPNAERDVRWLVCALADLGRWPEAWTERRYACCELRDAVERYQRNRGLRCDGLLVPGGETERTIVLELVRLGSEVAR
jgi:hypothetical protein